MDVTRTFYVLFASLCINVFVVWSFHLPWAIGLHDATPYSLPAWHRKQSPASTKTSMCNLAETHVQKPHIGCEKIGLYWEMSVRELEEALHFWCGNFGLQVHSHEEFSGDISPVSVSSVAAVDFGNVEIGNNSDSRDIGIGLNSSSSSKHTYWSRTVLRGAKGCFSLRLVHTYAPPAENSPSTTALRYISLDKAAFVGDENSIVTDEVGCEFVQGPGLFVKLENCAPGFPRESVWPFLSVSLNVWDPLFPSSEPKLETTRFRLTSALVNESDAEARPSLSPPVDIPHHPIFDLGGGLIPWEVRMSRQREVAKYSLKTFRAGLPKHISALDAFSYAHFLAACATANRSSLLFLLSPQCDICEARKPLMRRLALALVDHPEISLGVMDGSRPDFYSARLADEALNDMLAFTRSGGFPCLFFLGSSMHTRNPLFFDGKWTDEGVLGWIKECSGGSVDVPREVVDVMILEALDDELIDGEEDCGNCEL